MKLYDALGLRLIKSNRDPLTLLSSIAYHAVIADRFDLLNDYSCFYLGADPEVPTPNYQFKYSNNLPLAIENSVNKLLNQYKGKHMILMWSGGVDSTALLVALINVCDKKDFTIIGSLSSINENPTMVKWLYCNDYDLQFPLTNDFNQFKDCLILTGWCADQIFGSQYAVEKVPRDAYFADYKTVVRKMFDHDYCNCPVSNAQFDLMCEAVDLYAEKVLHQKVTKFSELALMINFGLKYTHTFNHTRLSCNVPELIYNIHCPYADPDIQDWGIANFNYNANTEQYYDLTKYKLPLKQYIFEFNHDQQYLLAKGKKSSWRSSTYTSVDRNYFKMKTDSGYQSYYFPYTGNVHDIRKDRGLLEIIGPYIKPSTNLNLEFLIQ